MSRVNVLSLLTLLLLVLPSHGAAQAGAWLQARGGVTVPTGDLADLEHPGVNVGGAVGLRLTDRLWVRLDGDASFLEGKRLPSGIDAPGINLVHGLAGIEAPLWPMRAGARAVELSASVSAGVTSVEVEAFADASGRPYATNRNTRPSLSAAAELHYPFSSRVGLTATGRAVRAFGDAADAEVSAFLDDEGAELNGVWYLPLSAGLRIRL